ncbi:hypothetical protein RRF57_012027 [Xylaria bambusicola]|uniref:FAD-binding domain-containing protein n=1 Tax=Xylaria bambusicola TaxID=326684 RepID=A0AAN7UNV4_9PEZI
MACIETDILIVGAGPAGASLGCFLTRYARHLQLQEHHGPTLLAMQHLVCLRNQNLPNLPTYSESLCAECLRDAGLEDECRSVSTPRELIKFYRFCHTMAGKELSRSYYAGNDPHREGEYKRASPCEQADLLQSTLEPILLRVATQNGFKLRWDYEFISFCEEKETGKVHSTIRDILSGDMLTVVSKYLCGADGAKSAVARELQLPFHDTPGSGFALNVWFEADLVCQSTISLAITGRLQANTYYLFQSHMMAHSAGLIHMVLAPDKPQPDYCAIAIIRQVKPFSEWVISMLAKPGITEVTASQDEIIQHVKDLLGDPSVKIKVKSMTTWFIQDCYAEQYARENVFCLGDAVHRHPPFNGLGSNTCIQDAYNLAWKIGYVQKGWASPSLLKSFSAERQPVGKAVVRRANKTGTIHAQLFSLMGVFEPDLAKKRKILDRLEENTEEGTEARAAFQQIIENLDSERHGFGVEMNQLYQSQAIWADDEPNAPPSFSTPEKADLHYLESTYPGFRLPHAWLRASNAIPSDPMISTHDLAGKGHFTILTGISGKAKWAYAALRVNIDLSVEIPVYSIGVGDYRDVFYDWSKKKGVSEDGAVLVRPDRFVAWRSNGEDRDPERNADRLITVVSRILGR